MKTKENKPVQILNIQDLSISIKSYEKFDKLLNSINLTINKNEIVGVVGETGSGKTTFAETILGYNKYYEGKIFIDNQIVSTTGNKLLIRKNKWIYKNIQMIFENSSSILNPNRKISNSLIDEFKNFKIIENEKKEILKILKEKEKEINDELFKYKFPDRHSKELMHKKVINVIENEKINLYKENKQNKFLYDQLKIYDLVKNDIKNLKSQYKYFRISNRIKKRFWHEEKEAEIKKIKINYSHDKNFIKRALLEEINTIKFNDDEYFLSEINVNKIYSEINNLWKTIIKVNIHDLEMISYLKKPSFTFNSLESEDMILKSIDKILKYLNYLNEGIKYYPSLKKYEDRFTYIKNLIDKKSLLNSYAFQKLHDFILHQINRRILEQTEIIEDIDKYIKILKENNKKIVNKQLLSSKRDEIISLNYEMVIFKEMRNMFNKFLEKINDELYIHNENNVYSYYYIVNEYNNLFLTIYLSILNWKFQNRGKFQKKEYKLSKWENKEIISEKKIQRAEIRKIINKNNWIQKNIDTKLKILKFNLTKDINEKEVKKSNLDDKIPRDITRKIQDLEYERKKLDIQKKSIEEIYSKENRKQVYNEKIEEVFKFLNLPLSILDNYSYQFSSLIQQKIIIARILIVKPKLIIVDEAITSLDSVSCFEILNLLKKIKEKYGISILFIASDFELAHYISDRIYIFNNGSIVEHGDTKLIYSNPIHPYTQFFINKEKNLLKNLKSNFIYNNESKLQLYDKYKNIITSVVEEGHFINGTSLEIEKWISNSKINKKNDKNR